MSVNTEPECAADWAKGIIEGGGGWKRFRQGIDLHSSLEHCVALWTLRCLANPECEGAKYVVEQLMHAHGIEAKEKPCQ